MSSSLHSINYIVFRDLLVKARLIADLTQIQVAEKLAKPQSYVSKYERGERRLDFAEFIQLADIMGIDTVQFIKEYRAELMHKSNQLLTCKK